MRRSCYIFYYLCIMYEDVKKEILAELRRDTNGAVVGTMFEMLGSEHYVNYGVTIPTIKKVAREYAPNHALAQTVFSSKIREMKLCAIYIDDPNEVTVEQMELWSSSFDSIEILENCCSMLFYKAPCALEVARRWIDKLPYAALLLAAKRARTIYNEKEGNLYIQILSYGIGLEDRGKLFHAKCQLLVALSNANREMRRAISLLELSDEVLDEINWQITEFSKEN